MRLNPNYSFLTTFSLGQVNYQLGNLDEAVAFLEQSAAINPTFIGTRVYLTAVYSEMGAEEKAQACVAKLRSEGREVPSGRLKDLIPYKNSDDADRLANALRKAGIDV